MTRSERQRSQNVLAAQVRYYLYHTPTQRLHVNIHGPIALHIAQTWRTTAQAKITGISREKASAPQHVGGRALDERGAK